jgi:ubiquinone/menaquinone biosynthesis C-methylase UbiE
MIANLEYIIYRLLIDPLLKSARESALRRIPEGKTLIDIASGTGTLAFESAEKCTRVTGVDIAESMIQSSNMMRDRRGLRNVDFIQADAMDLHMFNSRQFDYAVLSMAIHQFPEMMREKVLTEACRIARSIIIIDYNYPVPANISGFIVKMIERFAGMEHFRNFKNYCKNGGLRPLITSLKLGVAQESAVKNGTLTVMVIDE